MGLRKTTIDLPDALLRDAKKVALEERTSVKALIERGLRLVVSERKRRGRFTLRRASFKGDGLVAGRSLQDWTAIRDQIYAERGA
jgi:hypothetical protein